MAGERGGWRDARAACSWRRRGWTPPLPVRMGHPNVFTFYFKELDAGPRCQSEPQLPAPFVPPTFEATALSHGRLSVAFPQAGGLAGAGVKGRGCGGTFCFLALLRGDTAAGVGPSAARGHVCKVMALQGTHRCKGTPLGEGGVRSAPWCCSRGLRWKRGSPALESPQG